jgi:hypothetical protein
MKTMDQEEKLKYPIGKPVISRSFEEFEPEPVLTSIQAFPEALTNILIHKHDWSRTYRPGGWTAAQVVHHCADSHMNAFIRLKLALTEEFPVIKPYEEKAWALLADSQLPDVNISLKLLESLHKKWGFLLGSLSDTDWSRGYIHPDANKKVLLYQFAEEYSWHCNHHLMHIKIALQIA